MSVHPNGISAVLGRYLVPSICLSGLLVFSGCLKTESGTTTNSSTTPNIPSNPDSDAATIDLGFEGVSNVENIDGSTMKISWSAATSPNVVAYRVYEVAPNGDLSSIIQLPSTFLTYYHTGLIEGSYHSYVVRAVNSSNQTDGNFEMKFGYAYSGVAGVSITGPDSADINFYPSGPGTLGAKVYGIARGQTFFLGTVDNTASTFKATGLKSGVTYQFKVNAITAAGSEDSNTSRVSDQTTPLNASRYQGAMLVQAFGASPVAPSGPKSRQVSLTWLEFSSSTENTTYKVVRVAKGGTIDVTTAVACTPTTSASCNVGCAEGSTSLTGKGAKTCIDASVGGPPAAYDYIVTLNIDNWPEELLASQADQQRISVHIPPDHMVLVHRDSANYEQCTLMGRASDPLNNQRCSYTGLGAVPYNTGSSLNALPLNLSSDFYDFGYNLFVDRWEAACNWSRSASTQIGSSPVTFGAGKCGAGGANGDCFGAGAPVKDIGDINNVYYDTISGDCYIKTTSTTWVSLYSTTLTPEQRTLAYTNDPGAQNGHRPPIGNISPQRAQNTCEASVDESYGAKRILRQREFIAVAAWANIEGEPGAVSDQMIHKIEYSDGDDVHTTLHYCNTNLHAGIMPEDKFGQEGYELAGQGAGNGMESFVIGSSGTKACVSRFGAQDLVGNLAEFVSDFIICVPGTKVCTGHQSPYDPGNGFSPGFDLNGFLFDGVTNGPGGASFTHDVWHLQNGFNGASYFNTTLGIPLVNSNGGNAILTSSFFSDDKFHSDIIGLYPGNGVGSRAVYVGGAWANTTSAGRWLTNWNYWPFIQTRSMGFRCSLPAE